MFSEFIIISTEHWGENRDLTRLDFNFPSLPIVDVDIEPVPGR